VDAIERAEVLYKFVVRRERMARVSIAVQLEDKM
jgi:hypothetical protein